METKFSKGPWQYTKAGPADVAGMAICSVWGDGEVREADTHLIAAAPEMYDMLSDAADMLMQSCETGDQQHASDIRKLMAKARGETL